MIEGQSKGPVTKSEKSAFAENPYSGLRSRRIRSRAVEYSAFAENPYSVGILLVQGMVSAWVWAQCGPMFLLCVLFFV